MTLILKTLMLGKIESRRRERQRMRWLDGITNHECDDMMDMSLSKSRSWQWTGRPGVLQSMGSQRVGHDWATELNWTDWKAIVLLQTIFLTLRFRRSKWLMFRRSKRLTYLKQSRWCWSDQCMTNFKMTVWADCADFACSHLSLPIKLLPTACWEGQKLTFGQASTPRTPSLQVAGLLNKANFPFHHPSLFMGFRMASNWIPTFSNMSSVVLYFSHNGIWGKSSKRIFFSPSKRILKCCPFLT